MGKEKRKSHSYRDGNIVLYKRGKQSKFYQAQLKYAPCKYKRISTKKITLKDALTVAEEQLYDLKYRLKHNKPPESRRFKDVATLAKKQLQEELDAGYGKVIYKDYISAMNIYFIPFFKNTHIDNIDFKKLKQFDEWRTKKLGRQMSKSGIKNHNAALNYIFETAIKNGWLNEAFKPVLKNTGVDNSRRAYFTPEEYVDLYKFMREWSKSGVTKKTKMLRPLLRDYILILANTGIRHGTESMNLKWNNIDEFVRDEKKYLRLSVNGKTGQRYVIARHSVRRYLCRIQNRFTDLKDLSNNELFKVNEHVFRLEDGSIPKDLHGAFEKLMNDSGLAFDTTGKRRTLYSLRHTYATMRILAGINYLELIDNMGTSVQMLEKHYSHLKPSMIAEKLAG